MNITLYHPPLREELEKRYKAFLSKTGLRYEKDVEIIALMTDEDYNIRATGARAGHILKVFAVDPEIEDTGAFASLMSVLINDAGQNGVSRLFLCTKPEHKAKLRSMGFYPVIEIADAILMEDRRNGFEDFLADIPKFQGACGAIVMNGNPFTLGHRYLVEYAAGNCDHLYLFVVSEDASLFATEERFDLIRKGTEDIENCHVLMSDAYLVSRSTFPAYFIKDEEHAEDVKTDLDIELFKQRIASALNITKRFVGEEPSSQITKAYNERMKVLLPEAGIELIEIPRLEIPGQGIVSATKVRALMEEVESQGETSGVDVAFREEVADSKLDAIKEMVPRDTYEAILRKLGRNA